jgi:hypothetical protein
MIDTESEIPEHAKQIRQSIWIDNVDEWFCPDCNAHGDATNVDFIPPRFSDPDNMSNEWVEYCCGECFETNLYITSIEEDQQDG